MKKIIVFLTLTAILLSTSSCAMAFLGAPLEALTQKVDDKLSVEDSETVMQSQTEQITELEIDVVETTGVMQIEPGAVLDKDTAVRLGAGHPDCWVYISVNEVNNDAEMGGKIIEYSFEDNWMPLDGAEGVYYFEVKANDIADTLIPIFKDEKVYASVTITNADAEKINNGFRFDISAKAVEITEGDTPYMAWLNN